MPIKVLKKPGLVYIAYRRGGIDDSIAFKRVIESHVSDTNDTSDIALDFRMLHLLIESETAGIAAAAKKFQGTTRRLRIIGDEQIRRKITNLNLLKTGTVVVYESQAALLDDIKPKG